VDVDSAASVVTGHDGVERDNTVFITVLDTTESGVVLGQGVVGVAVATSTNTTVDTGGVAVPGLDSDVGERPASGGVNELDIKGQGNTGLVVGDVLTNKLTRNPYKMLGRLKGRIDRWNVQ
jgi:hypothetical protein